ncbi:MAG TPA: flagellar hook-length control protein FliK [Rhizorhapis sp.]|nr:flagellar hook-length control protein FliK [Rhizorhapis sp.]
MMANMPTLEKIAGEPLKGKSKAAPSEEAGADFLALLAGLDTGRADAPGQAVAVTHRSAFVTEMLQQRLSVEGAADGSEDESAVSILPAAGKDAAPEASALASKAPAANILMGLEKLKERPLEGMPNASEGQDKPAKLAELAPVPPQMALTVAGQPNNAKADTAAAKEQEEVSAEGGEDQDKVEAVKNPALPVLPGGNMPAAAAPASGAEPKGEKPPRGMAGLGDPVAATPNALPEWAAQPAQRHAAIGRHEPVAAEAGQETALAEPAPARPARNRQALALELVAASFGRNNAAEVPARAEKADAAAPLLPGVAHLRAVDAPPPLAASPAAPFIDVAVPLAQAVPAADTAAILGEQVIDMGVEGQWIDRMAREIADVAAGTGRASFTLNPENLGKLQVEILQKDEGANVRLLAETDAAASALHQGRQQLQQDARLQAVRIVDVQVERQTMERGSDSSLSARSQSSGQEMTGQQGQSQSFVKKPAVQAVSSRVTGQEQDQMASERARSQHARYA